MHPPTGPQARCSRAVLGILWEGFPRPLVLRSRLTTVKDRRKELPAGLLRAMVRQLGLEPEDLER